MTTSSDPPVVNEKAPWYISELTDVNPEMRKLLEERGIASAEVLNHVQAIRERGWKLFPYPCMGSFSFLKLLISRQSCYAQVLERLIKGKETLLDLGCALGQDIRCLVSAGAPADQIYGLDVTDGFVDLGYELFNDRTSLKSRFIIADAVKTSPPELRGKIDMIYAGLFFHLFNYDGQLSAAKHALEMLKPKAGAMIFGIMLGNIRPGDRPGRPLMGKSYVHNPETFCQFWKRVGEETGTNLVVIDLLFTETGATEYQKVDEGSRIMKFTIMRREEDKEAELKEKESNSLEL